MNIQPDGIILIFLILETIGFLLFHIAVIRRIGDRGLFIWLLREFFSVMLLGIIGETFLLRAHTAVSIIFIILLTQVLYGYLTMMYVQAIFGITLTSLRIQLLTEIFQKPGKKLSINDILKKYNRETLVKTRIFRLTSSGEIRREKGKYILTGKLSPFRLHMHFVEFLYRLYN